MAKKNNIDPTMVALANIEKQMGNKKEPIIRRFGDLKNKVQLDVISFGFKEIDEASNCGGLPRGKLCEIFGPEQGGKSLVSLRTISSAQKQGLKCLLVDAEQSFDPKWAKRQGVDIDDLYIMNEPMSAEKTLDYVIASCNEKAFGLIVIDSTAALVPQVELEGSVSDQTMGLMARIMSRATRALVGACASSQTSLIFVNQIRDTMKTGMAAFGDSTITPGGRALKFYSSIRMRVTPGGKIKVKEGTEERIVGRKSYITFVKNKVADPFGECEISIIFNTKALNPVMMLCNMAKNFKIIKTYKGEYKINGEPSECFSIEDLADQVVNKGAVLDLLDKCEEYIQENPHDKEGKEIVIDDAILEMREHPELIVSPKTIDIDGKLIDKGRELTEEEKAAEEAEKPEPEET